MPITNNTILKAFRWAADTGGRRNGGSTLVHPTQERSSPETATETHRKVEKGNERIGLEAEWGRKRERERQEERERDKREREARRQTRKGGPLDGRGPGIA